MAAFMVTPFVPGMPYAVIRAGPTTLIGVPYDRRNSEVVDKIPVMMTSAPFTEVGSIDFK
jgi:hypothetical protein